MLITLGVGTATGLYSAVVVVFCELMPKLNKTLITALVLSVGLLVSVVYVTPGGQQIVELVDFYIAHFVIIGLAILEVGAGKVYCI